jgi:hypothetical protein
LSGSETNHLSPKLKRLSAAALSQIGREEKAAAADKVSPIVRHRVSIARLKVMGFAALNPSYGLLRRESHFEPVRTGEMV